MNLELRRCNHGMVKAIALIKALLPGHCWKLRQRDLCMAQTSNTNSPSKVEF
jgi:hypothetical protein